MLPKIILKNIVRHVKKIFYYKLSYFYYRLTTPLPQRKIEELKFYKKFMLRIPTYEKSGQAVHPDIVVMENQPRFILVFTPYPATNAKLENPSILISDDAINFKEEAAGLNPLTPTPYIDHNNDPDVFFFNGIYYILYLETLRPEKQNLRLMQSFDRIRWENNILHTEFLTRNTKQFMLSPSFIEYNNEAYIYYVNKNSKSEFQIEYVRNVSLSEINFNDIIIPEISNLTYTPWHIDIIKNDGDFYMLITIVKDYNTKNIKYDLYIARSKDVHSWEISDKCILSNCYRSSGFIKKNILYIYYSENKPAWLRSWFIGIYKIKLDDFFNY